MAIMLLVNDGKLRYDEPLTEIFPGFPAYGRTIAIRHLLTHTGGLPEYGDLMEGGGWTETHQIQDEEVLELIEKQSTAKFPARSRWMYSNSGYGGARLDCRESVGRAVRRIPAEACFRSAAHGQHRDVSQRQE